MEYYNFLALIDLASTSANQPPLFSCLVSMFTTMLLILHSLQYTTLYCKVNNWYVYIVDIVMTVATI